MDALAGSDASAVTRARHHAAGCVGCAARLAGLEARRKEHLAAGARLFSSRQEALAAEEGRGRLSLSWAAGIVALVALGVALWIVLRPADAAGGSIDEASYADVLKPLSAARAAADFVTLPLPASPAARPSAQPRDPIRIPARGRLELRVGGRGRLALVGPAEIDLEERGDETVVALRSGALFGRLDPGAGSRVVVTSTGARTETAGAVFFVEALGSASRVSVLEGKVSVVTAEPRRRIVAPGWSWQTNGGPQRPITPAIARVLRAPRGPLVGGRSPAPPTERRAHKAPSFRARVEPFDPPVLPVSPEKTPRTRRRCDEADELAGQAGASALDRPAPHR